MSLYPSLEDMKVDQMAQAQVCVLFVFQTPPACKKMYETKMAICQVL